MEHSLSRLCNNLADSVTFNGQRVQQTESDCPTLEEIVQHQRRIAVLYFSVIWDVKYGGSTQKSEYE